ncbi:hypothetical protein [Dyadobacter frigoris]|uniref:Uncharacterized protein n=1 Tax=Dyadobacter frigoris TaxID=2576211 RepID=A0A4U6D4T9_9BACT|nr:hypothetical protein [Dyadobacter frigoris]TKT91018.1 hypothetical protein FDK13_18870 [Dyadobacter frigoris]GLU56212.1 hypothetical protein Dfri01_56730 [Dyadobacter frigoris]
MNTKQRSLRITSAVIFLFALLPGFSAVFAQVKIGTNPTTINAGSALEIESTNKGLLMPRISLANTTTWGLAGIAAAGMHVYNTNAGITSTNTAYPTLVAKIGEYYWDGTGWVALAPIAKSTSISSFSQSTPGVAVYIASSNSPLCTFNGGTPPPACAIDLNRNGTFTVATPINDITIDITGTYSVSYNDTQVNWYFLIAIDKTTPGVYEIVDNVYITHSGTGCSANYLNIKTALQNLPARTYNIKAYLAPWVDSGHDAWVGIGTQSSPGACGSNDYLNQKMVVSVSQ